MNLNSGEILTLSTQVDFMCWRISDDTGGLPFSHLFIIHRSAYISLCSYYSVSTEVNQLQATYCPVAWLHAVDPLVCNDRLLVEGWVSLMRGRHLSLVLNSSLASYVFESCEWLKRWNRSLMRTDSDNYHNTGGCFFLLFSQVHSSLKAEKLLWAAANLISTFSPGHSCMLS